MNDESVKSQILRQVEYYFGDINLIRDKFMREEMKKDNGWIDLTTMLKFNRLAQITTDVTQIAAALEDSDLIELSDDKTKIRRSPEFPLPDKTNEFWLDIVQRSVYVKGFDAETTLDEIRNFLAQYGNVQNVFMRRSTPERIFNGSIFATFDTRELADKFVKDETSMTYKEKPLTKMLQEEYRAIKNKDKKDNKKQKEKKKLQHIVEPSTKYVKGAVLEIIGFDPKQTKYEDLKSFFNAFGSVTFCAYKAGDKKAYIQFNQENAATAAWDAALKEGDGKVVFNDKNLTSKVLEGKEEEKYWLKSKKRKFQKKKFGHMDEKKSADHEESTNGEGKKRPHSGDAAPFVKKSKDESTGDVKVNEED